MSTVPPDMVEDVRGEAEKVAAEGVERARQAGFDAEPATSEGSPVWQRIVETAEERGAGIIKVPVLIAPLASG